MSANCHCHAATAKPTSAVWWTRVLMLVLFVFQISYTAIHIGTKHHFDEELQFTTQADSVHQELPDTDHHDGQHQPHSASDHLVQMRPQHTIKLLVVDFVVSETSLSLTPPETLVSCVLLDDAHVPCDIPPDPLQPRAPPLA